MKLLARPIPVTPAAIVLAGCLWVAGCEEPAPPPVPATPAPAPDKALSSEQQALKNALSRTGEQQMRKLAAQAAGFSDAVDGLLTEPGEERLATAQLAWKHLYRSYNEARTLLYCRALTDPLQAQRLARTDPMPILPGYIDSLAAWPGSGLVNDVTVPLDRQALLEQQGATSDAEASVGFQVLQFLLFGEPAHPRQAAAFQIAPQQDGGDSGTPVEDPEAASETASPEAQERPLDLMPLEDQPARRRQFLRLVAELLVEDLTLIARLDQAWAAAGVDCPVRAMGDTTRRLIQLENLADHDDVSGEYLAPVARELAATHLWAGMSGWLEKDSALIEWAATRAPVAAEQLLELDASQAPDVATLQRLHAALTTLNGGRQAAR